jgi:hypothetical protein
MIRQLRRRDFRRSSCAAGRRRQGDWRASKARTPISRARSPPMTTPSCWRSPRKQRAEVRRAIGFDLEVEVGRGPRDRDAHYAVYAASVRNLGTPGVSARAVRCDARRFGEEAEIMTVRREGAALASVLSFRHGDTIMPFWGGGTAEARTWRANDLMYWELMKRARRIGLRALRFRAVQDGQRRVRVQEELGASRRRRCATGRTARCARSAPTTPRYQRKIELWKKLPLPIANLLGPDAVAGPWVREVLFLAHRIPFSARSRRQDPVLSPAAEPVPGGAGPCRDVRGRCVGRGARGGVARGDWEGARQRVDHRTDAVQGRQRAGELRQRPIGVDGGVRQCDDAGCGG